MSKPERVIRLVPVSAATAVGLFGVIGILAQVLSVPAIQALDADHSTIAAMGFALAALALAFKRNERGPSWSFGVGQVLAFCVGLIGLLTLATYFEHGPVLWSRASIPTALTLVGCSGALLCMDWRTRFGYRPFEFLTLATLAIGLLALVGYACRVSSFYTWHSVSKTPMRLTTAIAVVVLCLGMFCARPNRGLMAILSSPGNSGKLARWLILMPVVIPLLTGLIRNYGFGFARSNPDIANWLFSFLNIFLFTAMIWWSMALLYVAERGQEKAQEQLANMNSRLEKTVAERTAALSDALSKFRCLVEQSLAGIYVIQKNRFTYVNPTMAQILGYSEQELTTKPLSTFIFEADRAKAEENVQRRLRGDVASIHYELRMLHRSGEVIEVEVHGNRTTVDGEPAIMGVLLDITERKRLEMQFLRSQRMESIGALAGGIAHDLNNALVPIVVGSEMLRWKKDPAEQEHMLELIRASADRCSRMVKQVLSFARGTRGGTGVVTLRKVIAEAEHLARDTFPKSISFSLDVPQDLWPVEGDATEVHQILLNLLVNARDAMPNGGQLKVKAHNALESPRAPKEIRGPHVVVSVADTGSGIPAETMSRIFEPFFTTKGPDKGTGLGLSTVAAIVKRYGGVIDVRSDVGKGSEFMVYLPAAQRTPGESTGNAAAVRAFGHGEFVLVIDDERGVLELVTRTLENYGYRVLTAANGMEGIRCFGEHREKIRVVLTDTDMPLMDGVETIRAIQEVDASIPIILTSGTNASVEEFQELDTTHMTRLNKPFRVEELLNGIASALCSAKKREPIQSAC